MKYKLALLVLFTVLIGTMGKPVTEAFSVVESYDGLPYANYDANSVLISSSGELVEKTTAASDTSTQFSLSKSTGSYMYLGFEAPFEGFVLDVDTNASGGSYSIDYYGTGGWKTLASETSSSLQNNSSTGVFKKTWDNAPTDWAKTSLSMVNEDGDDDTTGSLYFVRFVVENAYSSSPVFGRAGLIDYNLRLDVEDEIGNEENSLSESDFNVTTGAGDSEVYSYNRDGNIYAFALHAQGQDYDIDIEKDGFVKEEFTVNVDAGNFMEDVALTYSHKITGKDPRDSSDESIASAIAGSQDGDCEIDGGDAYCQVLLANDNNTTTTVWADGYAPTETSIGDRDSHSDAQITTSATLEYAYIATVKDSSGNSVSNATVTMGSSYGYSCTYLGSGEYGCVVPTSQSSNIKIVKSGYSDYTSSFSTTRNSNDDAQVTQSFTLTSGGSTDDDDQDLTVNDLYLDGEDLVFEIENEGEVDVSGNDDVYVYVYVDGDRELSERIDEQYLEAGEDLTVTALEGYFDIADEEWDVEVCIDATDDVSESDETNNCLEETLGEVYTSDEADLEVTELYLDEDGDLRYTFENTGDDDVSESSIEYTISVDGDVIETDDLSNNSDNDFFDAGEETTYNAGNILDDYFDEENDFDVEVCIDTDDDVNEGSESNNCMTVDDDDLDENGSSCGNFNDVEDHWAEEFICNLYDRDVVDGRTSTKFYPDYAVTRAEFLKMTLLGLEMDPYAVSSVDYDDVDSGDWHYTYVTYATAKGIVDGYSDGTFRPDEYINRAEAIVLLMRAADEEDYSYSSSDIDYWDVETSDWFAWAVVVADEFNIVDGYSDDSFRPENHITRAEASKIIDLSYEEFVAE